MEKLSDFLEGMIVQSTLAKNKEDALCNYLKMCPIGSNACNTCIVNNLNRDALNGVINTLKLMEE